MKYIVLSFDDGTKTFYTHAFRILQKYNLQAVLNVITDKTKSNPDAYLTWEEIKECKQYGIEIANHSSNHTNALDSIVHGAKTIKEQLEITDPIGFASPHSDISQDNFRSYKPLLDSGDVAYIRSGNQLKRDGYFHCLLYLIYKYTGLKSVFYWYNRRNILFMNQKTNEIFRSVTCNRDNTMKQIIHLIQRMPDNTSCIIMFHQIYSKNDIGYKKEKWSNTSEDFEYLCNYLNKNKNVSVISHKKLCEILNNVQHT